MPDTFSPIGVRVSAGGEIVVPQVFIKRIATQPIVSGIAYSDILWDQQDLDTDNMWDPAIPQAIRINTPGTYAINTQLWWNAGMPDGTHVGARLVHGALGTLADAEVKLPATGAADAGGLPLSAIFRHEASFPAATNIELEVRQFSGVNRNTRSGIFLRAVYLSP